MPEPTAESRAVSREAAAATVAYWRAVADIDKRQFVIMTNGSLFPLPMRPEQTDLGDVDQLGYDVDECYRGRRKIDRLIDELSTLQAKNVDEDVIKYGAQLQGFLKRESEFLERNALVSQEVKEYWRRTHGVWAEIKTEINILRHPWDAIDLLLDEPANQMWDNVNATYREYYDLQEDEVALYGRRDVVAAALAQRYGIKAE